MSLDALIWGRVISSDLETNLPAILRQRLGPQAGALIATLDAAAANIDSNDYEAAIYIVRAFLARKAEGAVRPTETQAPSEAQ